MIFWVKKAQLTIKLNAKMWDKCGYYFWQMMFCGGQEESGDINKVRRSISSFCQPQPPYMMNDKLSSKVFGQEPWNQPWNGRVLSQRNISVLKISQNSRKNKENLNFPQIVKVPRPRKVFTFESFVRRMIQASLSQFSWQGQDLCWLSLASIMDVRVVWRVDTRRNH